MKPAKLANRFTAHLIDLMVITAIWIFLTVFFMLAVRFSFADLFEEIGSDFGMTGELPLFLIFIMLISILIFSLSFHIYFVSMEFKSGQTFGKKWMDIKVVSIDGSPITKKQAIQRDLVKVYFELLFTVPLFYIFIDEKRQRLGDKWAKTIVIEHNHTETRIHPS